MFFNVNDLTTKRDVGSQPGTQWLLSSHKVGNGVPQLRDDSLNTLWQSDGQQPHTVSIQFAKRTPVTHVSIYLDYTMDDSYTATKIQIKAGTHYHDLQEVRTREFVEPKGWKSFLLDKADPLTPEDDYTGLGPPQPPIYVNLLQICVLANHLNGKDTHVRGIKVFSPLLPSNQQTVEDEILSQVGLNSLLKGKTRGRSRDSKVQVGSRIEGVKKDGKVIVKRCFDRSKDLNAARKKALRGFMDPVTGEREPVIKREDGVKASRASDSEMESIDSGTDDDVDQSDEKDEDEEDDADDDELGIDEGRQEQKQQQKQSKKKKQKEVDVDGDFRRFTRMLPELSKGFGSGSFGVR